MTEAAICLTILGRVNYRWQRI